MIYYCSTLKFSNIYEFNYNVSSWINNFQRKINSFCAYLSISRCCQFKPPTRNGAFGKLLSRGLFYCLLRLNLILGGKESIRFQQIVFRNKKPNKERSESQHVSTQPVGRESLHYGQQVHPRIHTHSYSSFKWIFRKEPKEKKRQGQKGRKGKREDTSG